MFRERMALLDLLRSCSAMIETTHADAVLADFLKGIEAVRPMIDRLVLFGSRARGDHRPDSDYDLLVVVGRRDPALLNVLSTRSWTSFSPMAALSR